VLAEFVNDATEFIKVRESTGVERDDFHEVDSN